MKPVIEVKGVAKSYLISHQSSSKAGYDTLKDDFAKLIKKPFGGSAEESHETFWALNDVSFEVKQGEIFGIIGRNGSGKSTLLKILSRIVEPTKGKAVLRGRTASLLEVGTGFHPELTGRENIYFNGSMLGMSRQEIRKKFDEIVAFSEVEKFLDTPVKFYSSGMYVRLAFSVAAHLDSEILILDEVLSVGDAGFQQKSLDKILSTIEDGRTVLFVSHSMGAVRQLCNRGILLQDGSIRFLGNVDKLVEKYSQITASDHKISSKKEELKNNHFDIEKIYIADESGNMIKSAVRSDNSLSLVLDLNIKKSSDDLVIGYALHTEEGMLIYSTYSADVKGLPSSRFNKGKIKMIGEIPSNLLNNGVYNASVIASEFNKFWIYEPDDENAPNVRFTISGGLAHKQLWEAARAGIIAPKIGWRIITTK